MMIEEKINSYQENYPDIYGYKWINEKTDAKNVVLIVHGMSEHAKRYHEFAEYLANKGFIVYAFDLIAHGKSCFKDQTVGYIPNGDFCNEMIKCITNIYHFIKEKYPTLKINLFAHSMGSMIAQRYIEINPNHFSKIILSGTDLGGIKYKMLNLITKMLVKKHGINYYSKMINKMTLGGFNKKFKKEQVKFGWLSVDTNNRIKYLNDRYCNKDYPVGYYFSLSKLLNEAIRKENLKQIAAEKILLITGQDDPVSSFSRSVLELSKKYSKVNINSSYVIIPNTRHEWHNEINKEEYLKKYVIPFYND